MQKIAIILIAVSLLLGWRAMTLIDDDCLTAWQRNPVSNSCKAYTSAFEDQQNVPLMVELENGQCSLKVACKNQYGGATPNPVRFIDKTMLVQLRNCNGAVQIDPC